MPNLGDMLYNNQDGQNLAWLNIEVEKKSFLSSGI
jgi:hypothetical protein